MRHVVAHKLAETERRAAELATLRAALEGLYLRLARAPLAECGHVGDCGCWIPTEEEVIAMTGFRQSGAGFKSFPMAETISSECGLLTSMLRLIGRALVLG